VSTEPLLVQIAAWFYNKEPLPSSDDKAALWFAWGAVAEREYRSICLATGRTTAPVVPKVKQKTPRKPPQSVAGEYQWTVAELRRAYGWSLSRIHRMFDKDPDCLKEGKPDRWENGVKVRGYYTLLNIPDHCVQREINRMKTKKA
jgi:hypothetical protein